MSIECSDKAKIVELPKGWPSPATVRTLQALQDDICSKHCKHGCLVVTGSIGSVRAILLEQAKTVANQLVNAVNSKS